eukprot:gene11996-13234_t
MAENEELRLPKKKKGAKHLPQPQVSFPILKENAAGNVSSDEAWPNCFGQLRGDVVVVGKYEDMTCLYNKGYFGKGSLSKLDPTLNRFGNTFDDRIRQSFRKETGVQARSIENFASFFEEKLKQNLSWLTSDENSVADLNRVEHNANFEATTEEKHLPSSDKSKTSLETSVLSEVPCKRCKLEDDKDLAAEYLQLSLEEAFFLAFGLGCLTVVDDDKERICISDLWKQFRILKPRFVESYTVYHYFRSKGWIVRDGIEYGSDFLLYKDGMPFYHSSYAVFSYLVDKSEIGNSSNSLPWTFPYLTCINRVAEHVVKEVLLCFVIKPDDFDDEELNSQKCLLKLTVQEILLRRWIPEKHRK